MPVVAAFSALWQYDRNTTMADPGARHFRTDGSSVNTQMALSSTDDDGADRHGALMALATGDHVQLRSTTTSGSWVSVVLTQAPSDLTSWVLLDVAQTDAGTVVEPSNNERVLLDFVRWEDAPGANYAITASELRLWSSITATDAGTTAAVDEVVASTNSVVARRCRADALADSPPELHNAALILAARTYKRRASPEGVAGLGDL